MSRLALSPPAAKAVEMLLQEYDDHLSTDDLKFIVSLVITQLREPEPTTLNLFEEELDEAWGQLPDPSADEHDQIAQRKLGRRLALTYAWRRAIDRLNRMTSDT